MRTDTVRESAAFPVRPLGDIAQPWPRREPAGGVVPLPDYVPDYVVDVSRLVVRRRWTGMLLTGVEGLALAWSVPFIMLLIGIPIVLAVAAILWAARFVLSYF